jgi:hypothetical protein
MIISPGLKPYFTAAAALGMAAMVFDTWLSGKFGWTISLDMAAIFGLVSLASGVLLVIAAAFLRSGHKQLAYGIAAAWVPIFGFNVMSNMGVATANRMTDVQQASFQQAKVAGMQMVSTTNEADVKRWQERLVSLNWAPSITAEMARAQLAEKQAAADRESKRGGCGSKCEAIKREVVELQRQIGAIEERAKINEQIAATKRVIERKQAELATADAGISQAANQAGFFAKVMLGSLYSAPGSQDVAVANEGMGVFTALVLAIVSALLTYIGAYPHLIEIGSGTTATRTSEGSHTVVNNHYRVGLIRDPNTGMMTPARTSLA